MSSLIGQDWTPKFAGQVQPERTESGLIFLTFYLTNIGNINPHTIRFLDTDLVSKNLNWEVFENNKKDL
jgi:hypothetical protein